MLKGVEEFSIYTLQKINDINKPMEETILFAKEKLPSRVYSKELIELLFEQPYCKVKFLVDKDIAKRLTATEYLQELEKIGILKSQRVGVENLFLKIKLIAYPFIYQYGVVIAIASLSKSLSPKYLRLSL